MAWREIHDVRSLNKHDHIKFGYCLRLHGSKGYIEYLRLMPGDQIPKPIKYEQDLEAGWKQLHR